jgi:hypothetical protein
MAEQPPAAVMRLVHGDTVDPGFNRTLSPELVHSTEDLKKDLLHHVAGITGVTQEPEGKVINGRLVALDQFLIGALAAGTQTSEETFVFRGEVRILVQQ